MGVGATTIRRLVAGAVLGAGLVTVVVALSGDQRASASSAVTVMPGTATCPVGISNNCTFVNVSSYLGSNTSQGFDWTMDIPGLPTSGMSLTVSSVATDSTKYSAAISGQLQVPSGAIMPAQLDAVWGSSSSKAPVITMAVQPVSGTLSSLDPAWTNGVDPGLTGAVLATSPSAGTLTVADLPAAAQTFYGGATTLAVGPGLSLRAAMATSSLSAALANALSYIGLGGNVTVSGTLSGDLAPLVDPASATAKGLDLTVASTSTSNLPTWVTSRTASIEFSDAGGTPTVTLADSLATDFGGVTNTFTGSATVSGTSFSGATVSVTYSAAGFNAPFGLGALGIANPTLTVTLTAGSSPSFSGEIAGDITVGSDQLTLDTTLVVSSGTVSGDFSLAGSGGVSAADALSVANTLLGTSVALPGDSAASGLALTGAEFSFSATSGDKQFALTAQGSLGQTTGAVLIAVDDRSGIPKLMAGVSVANLKLSSLVSGTSATALTDGLSFPSLDLFASTGYISNGKPTDVAWSDLLPAEQRFFDQVYAGQGLSDPATVSFGPTLSVQGALTPPALIASTFGITNPVVFSGDLGFGLDALGTGTPSKLGGTLTASIPALTSGLPAWLTATGPATLTLAADNTGAVSLGLAASADATIAGSPYTVTLSGAFTHTAVATTATLQGALTGTLGTGLFGMPWMSLTDPAVTLTLTRNTPAGGTATTSVTGALAGQVTIGGYSLDASIALSDGTAGASATVTLDSAPGASATLSLSDLVNDLYSGAAPGSLPSVTIGSLHIRGTASSAAGETLDVTASVGVTLPASTAPLSANLLLHLAAGGGQQTSVVAGFALIGSPTLSQILPAGAVPAGADFQLPDAAVLFADPAVDLKYAELTPTEQQFFQPFCSDASSSCHQSIAVKSGLSLLGSFRLPTSLTGLLGNLQIPAPTGDVVISGNIPLTFPDDFDLSVTLPAIAPTSAATDFLNDGQLAFDIGYSKANLGMDVTGTATFNIAKGSLGESACITNGGVWRIPRGGSSYACFDQVPFSIDAAVKLGVTTSFTLTGGLSPSYTWKAPMGATWLTLNQASIQLGVQTEPTPGASLGFLIGATVAGHDFSGAIAASVEVGPTGLDPNILGIRVASGSGLSMGDLVALGNTITGTSISLDSAKVPNLAVRNVLLSFSQVDDPQLCLPLGVHIAGDLYLNPGPGATIVSPSADCGGNAPNRTAICQQDTANGCLAAADIKIDPSGITASGMIGEFHVGPVSFQGAEVDLALTPTDQHLVVAGGISAPGFFTGNADLLVSPTQMEFRGSASLFGTGAQAYLDGSAAVNLTNLSDLTDLGSFNVTAVLQTTFLNQAEVAIATPLQKLAPVLQIVDQSIIDLQNGDVLAAVTNLPTQLANLGVSLPTPYGQVFQQISTALGTVNQTLGKADQATSATLDDVLNGITVNFPGIPGVEVPASCITTWYGGGCYTTPPVDLGVLGTVPGIPGIVVPATCMFTTVNGTCYSVPPFSTTIPGICQDLSSIVPGGLQCNAQGIFNDVITPVLRSAIKSATGYDMGNLDLTTFFNKVNQALTSNNLLTLNCAEFKASVLAKTSPSASVTLAAAGSVFDYPYNLGLTWDFAPNSDNAAADVSSLLSSLVNPQASTGTCGLPANWNANPDFPGVGGSVTAPPGVGSSGGSGSGTSPPPPTMAVSLGSATITEGSSAYISGTISPAPSSDTVLIDWGDGSAADHVTVGGDGSFKDLHAFRDITGSVLSAQYLVKVSDAADNLSADASLTVQEAVPSALSVAAPPGPTAAGTPVSLSGSFTDPASETHTVTAVWGDGSTSSVTVAAGSTSFSGLAHTYVEEPESDQPYSVEVTVSDDGGLTGTGTTVPVPVSDTPPTGIAVVPLQSPSVGPGGPLGGTPCPTCAMTTPEQQLAGFQVSFSYISPTDQVTAVVDWGDGISSHAINLGPGVTSFDIGHVWTEADTAAHPHGRFPVSVTLTDEDGGQTTTTATETVTNVAPANLQVCLPATADQSGACPTTATVAEGTDVQVGGAFTDPSAGDSHTVTIDWGWPKSTQTLSLPVGTFDFQADRAFGDEGTYPVKVTVTDDDGASTTATDTVHVTNVTPSASILPDGQTIVQGVPAYLSRAGANVGMNAKASDPGNDPLTLRWTYGDGAGSSTVIPSGGSPADASEDPTYHPVSGKDPVTHSWATSCLYNVGFSATDADGASSAAATDSVVTGTSGMAWQAGHWKQQFDSAPSSELDCDLAIVQRMSALFDGPHSVVSSAPVPMSTVADAQAVLQPTSSSTRAHLEREILTLWLDYANGAFTYNQTVHPSGSPATYQPTFHALMGSAESAALNPSATDQRMQQLASYLDGLIGR